MCSSDLFPGQQYEGYGGYVYNWMRDYEPWTGLYLQSDPLGLGGGLARYTYVWGNPTSFVDSTGLMGGGAGNSRVTNDWGLFVEAWWKNVKDTNNAIFGLAAPTVATLFTGRVAANWTGGITAFDVFLGFYRGTFSVVVGDALSVALVYGAVASATWTTSVNAVAVNGAFELGIGIGSVPFALGASLVRPLSCPRP